MEIRQKEPRYPRHTHSLFSGFFLCRSSKWPAASCLMASRFLVFSFFGVVLARSFFPHFSIMDSKTVQRSALCRSRRELSNEYLLAKIGVDTAENEPLEVWGENIQYYSIVSFFALALNLSDRLDQIQRCCRSADDEMECSRASEKIAYPTSCQPLCFFRLVRRFREINEIDKLV